MLLNRKSIAKGTGVALIGLVGGLLATFYPILGGTLCIIAFLLGIILLVQGEVDKVVLEEKIESITRILSAKGLGNAPHDAFEKAVLETGNFTVGLKHLQDALDLEPDNPKYNAEIAAYFALLVSGRDNCSLRPIPSMIADGKKHAERSLRRGGYKTVAHVAMGMLLDNEGRHGEAQQFFKEAGQMGDPWHHVYLCTSYGMAGDFAKALNEIEQHNNTGLPAPWVVHICHGRALLRTGHYRDAEAELRTALEIRGAYPGLALSLSESIFMQGRFLEANRYKMREALLLLAVNIKRSIRLFTEIGLHGTIYVLTATSRSVVRVFKGRTRLTHAVSRIIPPYEPHATLSGIAFSKGHIVEAYDLLKQALVFGAQEARLWGNLATISMGMGRHAEAADACSRAQELEPNNPTWKRQAKSIQAVTSEVAPFRVFRCTQSKEKDEPIILVDLEQVKTKR